MPILFGTEYIFFFFWFAFKTYKAFRTAILRIALYACETWSLTLREERRLSVFDDRVLRKMFEPKRGLKGTAYSTALRTVHLTRNYCGGQTRKNKVFGSCGTYGEEARCVEGYGDET
jgi:hypothetical protein